MVCDYRNEVIYIDKNLTSAKKIPIPNDFKASQSKFEDGVIYRNEFDKRPGEREYVFDEDEYKKAGKPEKWKKLKSKIDYVKRFTPQGEILYLKKASGELTKIWESDGSPALNILRISDETIREVYFNISLYSADHNNIGNSILLKVSPEGTILTQMIFQPDDVVDTYGGARTIPLDVDKNGNIYRMRTNKDGVLIDKWSEQ